MSSSHVNTPINKSPAAEEDGNPPHLSNINESSAVADDSGSVTSEVVDAQPSGDDNNSISSDPGGCSGPGAQGATKHQRRGGDRLNGDGEMDGGAQEEKEKSENKGDTSGMEDDEESEPTMKEMMKMMTRLHHEGQKSTRRHIAELKQELKDEWERERRTQNEAQMRRHEGVVTRLEVVGGAVDQLDRRMGTIEGTMPAMVREQVEKQVKKCFEQHMRNVEPAGAIEQGTRDVEPRAQVCVEKPVTRSEPPRLPVPAEEHRSEEHTSELQSLG